MIRFKKQENGNVLITDENDNITASYNAGMNVFKHPSRENSLLITDDASARETSKGLTISFASVDLAGCSPAITASDSNGLIDALSNNFFFRKPVVAEIDPDQVTELVYKGEFAASQDIVLFDGTDFKVSYEGSSKQIRVENKANGWFDVFARATKGSGVSSIASDVAFGVGTYYLSDNGNSDNNFALNNLYASHLVFRVAKESITGKEILFGEIMRAGNMMNANLHKIN